MKVIVNCVKLVGLKGDKNDVKMKINQEADYEYED